MTDEPQDAQQTEEETRLSSTAPDIPVPGPEPGDLAPDNDEPGDEEDEATRDLPTDDYDGSEDEDDQIDPPDQQS